MTAIGTQIDLVVTAANSKGLGEFTRTGAKLTKIVNATALLHQFDSLLRFERANQNKAVCLASDEHV